MWSTAQYRLTKADEYSHHQALDGFWFTCGSSPKELEVDKKLKPLFDLCFVRRNLSCDDPVEIPYYSSEWFLTVCIYCACKCDSTEPGKYPICEDCKE